MKIGSRTPLNEYPVNLALSSNEPISNLVIGIIRPDRNVPTWAQCDAYQVRESDGSLQQIVVTFFDVTERKQAEEALREAKELYQSLFDQSADAVFLLTMEGRHVKANKRAAEMLGYNLEEILNLGVNDISAQIEDSKEKQKKLLNGELIPNYERLFRKKNGELICEPHVTLIRDIEGKPYRIQSIVRDITERKQAEESSCKKIMRC